MKLDVLLFAALRETVGASRISVEVPDRCSVEDLRAAVHRAAPALFKIPFAIAVNRTIAASSVSIEAGSEVACIPPVSGG